MSQTRRVRVAASSIEVGDRPRAAFLREPDQREQHLGRRLRVRKRAVARLHRRADEVRELGEARARHAPREQAPRERHRVDDGRRDPRAGEQLRLAVEEGEVEAGVVRDEHRVAGEGEEPADGGPRRRRAAQLPVGQPGERRRARRERRARIHERLEVGAELESLHAHRADLADLRRAGAQAGRLEVDDDVRRLLEQEVAARRLGERDGVAAPGEPCVRLDHLGQERAREGDRGLAQREEPLRRLVRDDRAATLLDELHQPVGGV